MLKTQITLWRVEEEHYASVRVFTHRNFRSRCVLVREDTNQGEEYSGAFVVRVPTHHGTGPGQTQSIFVAPTLKGYEK